MNFVEPLRKAKGLTQAELAAQVGSDLIPWFRTQPSGITA